MPAAVSTTAAAPSTLPTPSLPIVLIAHPLQRSLMITLVAAL